jgi:glycosyltransferase involved in cell wall biosynthesis
MNPYLSVIIPSYNEASNFKKGKMEQVYSYLKAQKYSFEIIFVDDGSDDHTADLLNEFSKGKSEIQVIANKHLGKGPTVAKGLMVASGENRLFTDFDQATPIEEIEKLLPFVNRGYDVIIGSREVEGAKREKEPLYRHIMGKGFNLVVKIFIIRGINDTQCGFKLLSQKACEKLVPMLSASKVTAVRKDAFTGAFDVELLFVARKNGFRVAEVPVSWQHFKTDRVNPVKDSLRMFFEVLKIRLNALQGKYKTS